MAECFQFLLPTGVSGNAYDSIVPPDRQWVIGGRYAVVEYCNRAELSEDNYFYSAVPRCFALMQEETQEALGIRQLRELPGFDLYGNGVLIGIVDTGVVYRDEAFRTRDGRTRIVSIWDQTMSPVEADGATVANEQTETGDGELEIPFGTRYTGTQLQAETAPTTDTIGHGTALLKIAAGSTVRGEEGIAPNAELVVVRLRQAGERLKRYHRIQGNAPCYSEADIMLGLQYLDEEATRLRRPLVILLALGSNSGGHRGNGYLEQYIGDLCRTSGRQVVVAAGNEGNAGHHFFGIREMNEERQERNREERLPYEIVQFRVEQGEGLTAELWCEAPALFAVGVESPGGEVIERVAPISGRYDARRLILEGTTVVITYQTIGLHSVDPLVLMRFSDMSEGVWTIRVYPERSVGSRSAFDVWLPVRAFLRGEAEFLKPDPNTTVTSPGNAKEAMTVTAYDPFFGSIYPYGGRGYTAVGIVKPDLAAPYEPGTEEKPGEGLVGAGTSLAVAAAAGTNALLFEWASVRGNRPFLTGTEATAYFINGAVRDERKYPNPEWGYGKMNLYEAIAQNR